MGFYQCLITDISTTKSTDADTNTDKYTSCCQIHLLNAYYTYT